MNQPHLFALEAALALSESIQANQPVSLGKDDMLSLLNSYLTARTQWWRSQVYATSLLAERSATAPQEVANRPKESLEDAYRVPFSADDGA